MRRKSTWALVGGVLPYLALALAPSAAAAEEKPEEKDAPWVWTVSLATEVPLSATLDLSLELPSRWILRTGLGAVPEDYIKLADKVAQGLGAYGENTGTVIRTALRDAAVFHFDVGYRPYPGGAWSVAVGYTAVALGGSATNEQVLAAATGTPAPAQQGPPLYNLHTTLQLLDIESSWEWALSEHWVFRTWCGWAFTANATSQITFNFNVPLLQPIFQAFADAAALELDSILETYVHPPLVGAEVGYRF